MFYRFVGIVCFISCFKPSLTQNLTDIKSLDASVWCKFQPNSYQCFKQELGFSRFYYDIKLKGCRTFQFGDCPYSNYNNFNHLTECNKVCRDDGVHEVKMNVTANVFCRYQPDFGSCHNYHPMWYFDISERICKGFSYSGCGGNLNRFANSKLCIGLCSQVIEYESHII